MKAYPLKLKTKGRTIASGKRLLMWRPIGFTLVEVAMAVGLFSISVIPILSLLPVGLNSTRNSVVQVAESGIVRQVRSDLSPLSLSSVSALDGKVHYYTQQGVAVRNSSNEAYYSATFSVKDPTVTGAPPGFNSSALAVTVILQYPHGVPAASQKSNAFSFLVAGQ